MEQNQKLLESILEEQNWKNILLQQTIGMHPIIESVIEQSSLAST